MKKLIFLLFTLSTTAAFSPVASLPKTCQMGHLAQSSSHLDTTHNGLTSLHMAYGDNKPDPTGLKRGYPILAFAMLVSIWIFSIPTEFRRATICDEETTLMHPESKCMTWETWTGGISDYYKNGGGVKFDFSIEEK